MGKKDKKKRKENDIGKQMNKKERKCRKKRKEKK